jgi:rhodanese-related sulfurtransferase
MDALSDRPELVSKIERITAVALFEQLTSAGGPIVVDVRSEKEWSARHILDSVNIPLNRLSERAHEIPENRPVVVHCEGGYRSAIAASLLARVGRADVFDMVGGYNAWAASKLPVHVAETGA